MKLFTRMVEWGALAAMAVATTALAQKEQWLDYHVNRRARGYRYLNLTTNPPPNVKLPKLNAPAVLRALDHAAGPGGPLAVPGPHEEVRASTTASISTPPAMGGWMTRRPWARSRTDQYSAYFEPVRVVFKGEDGPITYHLVLRFMQYGAERCEPDAFLRRILRRQGGYRRQEAAHRAD